jgi:hypothetical protein
MIAVARSLEVIGDGGTIIRDILRCGSLHRLPEHLEFTGPRRASQVLVEHKIMTTSVGASGRGGMR